MDYLESVVFNLVKLGGLTVKGKDGAIDLALILEEAVDKDILPNGVLDDIGSLIEMK